MRYYCTYFDHNYLARGLALYESLRRFSPDFRLSVLCLSDLCHAALQQLGRPDLDLIALAEFERDDPALTQAKANRSLVEYYFTCTPALAWFVLQRHAEVDAVSYLDSDLYFFNDPELIFQEIGAHSVAITPHRFPPALKWKEKFGVFNVGWLTFRRDEQGLACLKRWRSQCVEWCYDRYEDGRFADQKYLDEWPGQFSRLKVLEHPGINAAPWNLAGSQLTLAPRGVLINAKPLVLFHFHKLKQAAPFIYDPKWAEYNVVPNRILRRHVYAPYIEHLERLNRETVVRLGAAARPQHIRRTQRPLSPLRRLWRASPVRPAWYGLLAAAGVVRRRNFLVCRGRVLL